MRLQQDLSGTQLGDILDQNEAEERMQAKDILKFYLDTYPEVYTLICDGCKTKLAIEYLDFGKPNPNHHQSRQVIPISDKLKSYRPRLDGAMGYKCQCGNDTRLADVERGIVPVVKIMSDGTHQNPPEGLELHPHHTALVQQRMAQLNAVPDIRLKGKDTITETFRVRRLK